jgi:CDP-paratose synthetase
MKIILTGGTGFLGRNLLKSFVNDGHEVIVISRRKPDSEIFRNIDFFLPDSQSINKIFTKHKDVDIVIHSATDYGRSTGFPEAVFSTNLVFPMNLLKISASNHIKYFFNIDTFFNDKESNYSHLSEYSTSKRHFQEWGNIVAERGIIRFINLKMFHLYGPDDSIEKFIPSVIVSCLSGIDLNLTAGTQKRDFIFVEDAVSALNEIFYREMKNLPGYSSYEIGTGFSTSIKEVVNIIKKLSGSNSELNFGIVPARKGEFTEAVADIKPLKSTGWAPKFSLENGLKSTIESYRGFGNGAA